MRTVGFDTIIFFVQLLTSSSNFEISSTNTILRCRNRPGSPRMSMNTLTNCHRKIRIEVRIENAAESEKTKEYHMIDTVRDPKTNLTRRLLNPITLQIRQETLSLAYPFHYLSGVNGKAHEVVISKDTSDNYTGCNARSKTLSVCGTKHHNGQPIPYSQGFCCFCKDSGYQKRGGQRCDRDNVPDNVESAARYLASTHCLVFDQLWYVVTSLSYPVVYHSIYFHAYIRRETEDGEAVWWDFNERKEIVVGSQTPRTKNRKRTLIAGFIPRAVNRRLVTINITDQRLLIPLEMPEMKTDLPGRMKNDPENYLLVSKRMVNTSGKECDRIGVSYEAFYKQRNRCENPRDSCLRNQPLDLWTKDIDKRTSGQNGSYLLPFYGKPHKDPILHNKTSGEHWLIMELPKYMTSSYFIEMDAANITALSPGRFAQIDAVITTVMEESAKLTVFITNLGLTRARFKVQVVGCSGGGRNGRPTIFSISPQRKKQAAIFIKMGRKILVAKVICEVVVSTRNYGVIAVRKATIMPGSPCSCYYYCRCDCSRGRFTCTSMNYKQFHRAGFRGSLPFLHLQPPQPHWLENSVVASIFFTISICLTLGFLKVIIGETLDPRIRVFGIEVCLYRKKKLMQYYEPELKDLRVIYKDGYPINPDTREPARAISRGVETALNVLFFLIWPGLLILNLSQMITKRRDRYKQVIETGESHIQAIEEKHYLIDRFSGDKIFNSFLMKGYISAKIAVDNQLRDPKRN